MPRKRLVSGAPKARVALRLFRCDAYSVSLSPSSCAKRHRASLLPTPLGSHIMNATDCVTCPIGRSHAKGLDAEGMVYVERVTSAPCSAPPLEALEGVPDEPKRPQSRAEYMREYGKKRTAERASRRVVAVETHEQLVARVRPVLEAHPFATADFARELLGREGATPSFDHVRRAMREVRGGADGRTLNLGGHAGRKRREAREK